MENESVICGCGSCTIDYQHQSDCAVHNMPAMKNGKCNCKKKALKPLKNDIVITPLVFPLSNLNHT